MGSSRKFDDIRNYNNVLTDLSNSEFTYEDCIYKCSIDLNGVNPDDIANAIRDRQEKVYMVKIRLSGK